MQTTPQNEARDLAALLIEYCETSEATLANLGKPHSLTAREIERAAEGKLDELAAEGVLDALRAIAAEIGGSVDAADPLYEDMGTAKLVRQAFTRLRMSNTKAKLVIVEGQTGMGKTSAGEIISAKMRALNPAACIFKIEATAAWRGRAAPMMAAMLRALGMPDNSRSASVRLEKLVDALNQRPAVFIIDEIHDGGVDMLRTLKTLLNRSPLKLVLLAHPRLFRDLENEAWDDVRQLTGNRLLARIDLGRVTEADTLLMLTKRLPKLPEPKKAAATLAKAAHGNGNYALIREIIARLQKDAAPTLASVEDALRAELLARRALNLSA